MQGLEKTTLQKRSWRKINDKYRNQKEDERVNQIM